MADADTPFVLSGCEPGGHRSRDLSCRARDLFGRGKELRRGARNEASVEHSVDHSATMPWRRATLLVGAVAAVELVLLIVAGVALLGNSISHGSRASAATKRTARAVAPAPAAKHKRH